MRFTLFNLTLLAAALLAANADAVAGSDAFYVTDPACQDEGCTVSVKPGSSLHINWLNPIKGKINIRLVPEESNKNAKTVKIASNIGAHSNAKTCDKYDGTSCGSFDWTVPTTVKAGQYSIDIHSLARKSVHGYSDIITVLAAGSNSSANTVASNQTSESPSKAYTAMGRPANRRTVKRDEYRRHNGKHGKGKHHGGNETEVGHHGHHQHGKNVSASHHHHHHNKTTVHHGKHHKNATAAIHHHHHHRNHSSPHAELVRRHLQHKNETVKAKHHHHKNETVKAKHHHHHKNATVKAEHHHHKNATKVAKKEHHKDETVTTKHHQHHKNKTVKAEHHHHKNTTKAAKKEHHHHKNSTAKAKHHHHKNTTKAAKKEHHHKHKHNKTAAASNSMTERNVLTKLY